MLWFVLVAMACVAVVGALWPLVLRRKSGSDAASEVAFYKAQLGEIERDVERGQLPADEAAGARAEAARRLIAASAAANAEGAPGAPQKQRLIAAAIILVAAPLAALALYADLGQPNMPDEPLASRASDASTPEGVEAAVARIEAHLIAAPDDGRGWAVLAPVYMRLGRFDDAANAFRQALRVNGEEAVQRANYGEAMVAAANGVVTADARAAFEKALVEQPGLAEARFYLGLAAEQDGDKAKAISTYKALLADAPADAPWANVLKSRLTALESGATPAALAVGAPSASTVEAAPPDEQQKMVRDMVERAAARLAKGGGNLEEWQQLIRSYAVMRQPEKAKDALAAARKDLAANAAAGPALDALAQKLGIETASASPQPTPAPSAPATVAAAPAPAASEAAATTAHAPSEAEAAAAADEKKMVREMVDGLAARLAKGGGNLDQWRQLIRSYVVMHEVDKAKDALATARTALAADAAAGPALTTLAQNLGLEPGGAAPAAASAAPKPDPSADAAAAAEQDKQVREMVAGLAARLAKGGGNVEQWGELVRSYMVMQQTDKAKDALAAARKALAADAAANKTLDALAQNLGLEPASAAPAAASAAPAPAPSASPTVAATPEPSASEVAAASDDDQQKMVRDMVSRLATRLAKDGGDSGQWQQLIRSYAVLHETDKAKDALSTARKALAGDAAAGPALDALAQELGIGG